MEAVDIFDVIVIGSGPSGAQCAQTLTESGLKVLMLDGGNFNNKYEKFDYSRPFTEIRGADPAQYQYLLGEFFEGIPDPKLKTGAQLTPARKYILQDVADYLSYDSENFLPMESLAYGGLGSGWGLGSCVFSDGELVRCGLNPHKMKRAYQKIADRIGITQADEDIVPFVAGDTKFNQGFVQPDTNHYYLWQKYLKKRRQLNKGGIYMGRPALALLLQDRGDRHREDYNEWGFYSDLGMAAYRPWITINELKKEPNFKYVGRAFAHIVSEDDRGAEVSCINMDTNDTQVYKSKGIILCAGTLGTARLLLRSGDLKPRLPLLCNPYSYVTCLQPALLNSKQNEHRHSFAQLSLFYDPDLLNNQASMGSLYSYRSLMLLRTIGETTLNFRDSRILLQFLVPALTIAGIHHPDVGKSFRYIEWLKDGHTKSGDRLHIDFKFTTEEDLENSAREKKIFKALRLLSCYPLKRINPGNGASIHYAGTLPFSEKEMSYRLRQDGRVGGYKRIYVGDGSGFAYLPAKGLTLSLMANAHLVAETFITNYGNY